MDVMEKLVELLITSDDYENSVCLDYPCKVCPYKGEDCTYKAQADHLIDHGVTVQEWIPVTERLPELIPCNAGTAYSEAVNVLTSGRKIMVAIWDGIDWLCDMDYWEAWGEEITHWTPVLLPLPEPPKGE